MLAEGALRAHLDHCGLDWVEVDSAGTGGWHAGEPPDRRSIAVAAAAGVDIRSQRARKLRWVARVRSVKSIGAGTMPAAAGPSPRPVAPWQPAHCAAYRPAAPAGSGVGIAALPSP